MIRKSLLTLTLACAFSLQADVTKITDEASLKSELSGDKPVVVKFFAEWCGPCQQLAPIFDKIADENSDKAKFLLVDVDKNSYATNSPYDVKSMPTVVFFKNGKEASRLVGGRAKEKYVKELNMLTGGSTPTRTMEEAPVAKKTTKKKPAKKAMKKKGKKKTYPVDEECNTCG